MDDLTDVLCIELAQSLAYRQTRLRSLILPAGSTVSDALHASNCFDETQASYLWPIAAGIWGRHVPLSQVLRDGDRVELYRPLQVDPKEARRLRYAARGAKPKINPQGINGNQKQ